MLTDWSDLWLGLLLGYLPEGELRTQMPKGNDCLLAHYHAMLFSIVPGTNWQKRLLVANIFLGNKMQSIFQDKNVLKKTF